MRPEGSEAGTLTGLRDRWRLVPNGWRAALIIAAVVVVAGALVRITSALTEGSSPVGPASSSFSPTSDGLAAYAELLSKYDHQVTQLTSPLTTGSVAQGSTLVVAAPDSWTQSETQGVVSVIQRGGRVIVMGQPPPGLMESMFPYGNAPGWSQMAVTTSTPTGTSQFVYGVSTVASSGPGSWSNAGITTPLLVSGGVSLALFAQVGAGSVILLGSPAPLQDRLIGEADNAAFALDISGGLGAPVVFDEYDHGYGQTGGGYGGLPDYWKAAFVVALIAVLVWMWSASRRLGPPEEKERLLAPARVRYVDAMATLLSTAEPEELPSVGFGLQARARSELCRVVGVSVQASDDEVARAARSVGIDESLIRAALVPPGSSDEMVYAGRAVAELAGRRMG
jgi:hypothetical protein